MFLKYNVFTIAMAGLVLVLTLTPGSSLPDNPEMVLGMDKVIHFTMFAFLALLTIVGFSKQYTFFKLRNRATLYSLVFCIAFSLFTECCQILIPGRSFDGYDILTNVLGILFGRVGFLLIYKL